MSVERKLRDILDRGTEDDHDFGLGRSSFLWDLGRVFGFNSLLFA